MKSVECRANNNCQDNEYYYWFEGALAGQSHEKYLCISCPLNCPSCDESSSCLECSSYSTLDSKHTTSDGIRKPSCKCGREGCMICQDTECDLCSSDLSSHRSLHILLNDTRYCLSVDRCADGFFDTTSGYSIPSYDVDDTFTALCRQCATDKCRKCDASGAVCEECMYGYYLLDEVCRACGDNCLSCADSSSCTKCDISYYLLSNLTCDPFLYYYTILYIYMYMRT